MKKAILLWLSAIFINLSAFADGVNMLSFALSDGTNTFDAFSIGDAYIDIQVPQGTDLSAMTVIFTHDGERVVVKGENQVSGVSKHDFSDFTNPIRLVVADVANKIHAYTVRLFNLPIVFVETEDHKNIVSKEDWLTSTFTVRNEDGTVVSLGTTNIKGRGNTSWSQQDKKPYTIKLEKKQKVLGMHKHKRWHLLSTYGNAMSFFRDDMMFWMARHTASLGWAPHGRFAELFVNGEHKGLYWICEKISIDNNRVNITELSPEDTDSEAVTGGYLLEFADYEEPQFDSDIFNLHYCLNNPNENVPDEQLNYIKDYINNLESSLADEVRFANREYEDLIDVDTWIDYWFMHEMAQGTDIGLPGYEGLSCFCYKDRGGKLKAGPVWDMHFYAKSGTGYHAKDKLYYKRLFDDPKFVQRVKDKWYGTETESGFPDLMGNGIQERVDSIKTLIQQAGDRDLKMWGKNETIAYQAERAITKYKNNIHWMNFCLNELPFVKGRGDVDKDGKVTTADVEIIKNYLIQSKSQTSFNEQDADADGNGIVTVRDFILIIEKCKVK